MKGVTGVLATAACASAFGGTPSVKKPVAPTKTTPTTQALPPNMDAYTACNDAGFLIDVGTYTMVDPSCMSTYEATGTLPTAATILDGSDPATWSPFPLEPAPPAPLGSNPATWSPFPLEPAQPAILGNDPATWSPKPALGSDPATWTPNMAAYTACSDAGFMTDMGGWTAVDPACVSTYEATGALPAAPAAALGSDPATWSPFPLEPAQPAALGSDPATWTPNMAAYTACSDAGFMTDMGGWTAVDPACISTYEATGALPAAPAAALGSDPATWSPFPLEPGPVILGNNAATWSPFP